IAIGEDVYRGEQVPLAVRRCLTGFRPRIRCLGHAAVAELADAQDSGSCTHKVWRFDSSRPHSKPRFWRGFSCAKDRSINSINRPGISTIGARAPGEILQERAMEFPGIEFFDG